mmetsp:Transcript_109629/g.244942  ORF Transcript_109629/g.244942 Transcript_109629/m.244942 type:complete len:200 (-) Transcript_109629:815-1414(-)
MVPVLVCLFDGGFQLLLIHALPDAIEHEQQFIGFDGAAFVAVDDVKGLLQLSVGVVGFESGGHKFRKLWKANAPRAILVQRRHQIRQLLIGNILSHALQDRAELAGLDVVVAPRKDLEGALKHPQRVVEVILRLGARLTWNEGQRSHSGHRRACWVHTIEVLAGHCLELGGVRRGSEDEVAEAVAIANLDVMAIRIGHE